MLTGNAFWADKSLIVLSQIVVNDTFRKKIAAFAGLSGIGGSQRVTDGLPHIGCSCLRREG